MVIIDADFFIGLFNEKDFHYETCKKIYPKVQNRFLVSWDVIDEVVTKLCYFGKKDIAFEFIKLAWEKKSHVSIPNRSIFVLAQEILKNQIIKHVSFTDCMNMAIARKNNIEYILSFDKIYEKNGFKLFN